MPAPELVRQFEEDGFCILPDVFGPETLDMLREESDLAVEWQRERIRRGDPGVDDINQADSRYFVPGRAQVRPRLRTIVFGPLMADLCRALVGQDAYLFTDVFVCKAAGSAISFGWHQDYGYLCHYGYAHYPPNLSLWAPLDDVSEENGALRVLPFSRGGTRQVQPHHVLDGTRDRVADFGGAPGELVPMRAGSLLVLSGLLPHMSGPNRTARPRRAYLWQYSSVPILDGGRPIMRADPLLVGGHVLPHDV